jgi:hypothetical protein
MADSESYYRTEARRCRAMARAAKTGATARRWAELADEYEQLAVVLERGGRRPANRLPRQQPQVVQQPQAKLRSDKP